MKSIAHIREHDHAVQTVEEHLLAVQKIAETIGSKIGLKHVAGLAGMLHDLGKYNPSFAEYIEQAVLHPDLPNKARGKIDHSTAGGKLLYDMFHVKNVNIAVKELLVEIVGNAIISHHSYLQDFIAPDGTSKYLERVKDKALESYDEAVKVFFEKVITKAEFQAYVNTAISELQTFLVQKGGQLNRLSMFITKYIFSALIDADRTNTREFEENTQKSNNNVHVDNKERFKVYYDKLLIKLNHLQQGNAANSVIANLRQGMSDQCDAYAEQPSDIYTLSIPTGGGKTLASLRYALKHAINYEKKRIIYVVPFTTIIEQNAQEVRSLIDDDYAILEHHSNVIMEDDHLNDKSKENDESENSILNAKQNQRLAKDNWDSPIIFTTMVQFLNVFYAKGTRNIRRLHNLTDSIIIFDEVQKVPIHCIALFNEAVNFIKSCMNSSVLLCTATQPALDYVKYNLTPKAEIIENIEQVSKDFRRVNIVDHTHVPFTNTRLVDFIAERLEELNNVLVILNTKSVVRDLYIKLKEYYGEQVYVYHLSTSMCSSHRKDILEKVKEKLRAKEKVVCISTQLIEAGVDISFQCVIRSLAGLDSIAQAAGRCNRHGEESVRDVYVIQHAEEKLDKLVEIEIGAKCTKTIFSYFKVKPEAYDYFLLSNRAIKEYFEHFFFDLKQKLTYPLPEINPDISMMQLLGGVKSKSSFYKVFKSNPRTKQYELALHNSYGTAADYFEVIQNQTESVLVPYKDGVDIIAQLNGAEKIEDLTRLLKQAQQYMVNIYHHEREKLSENHDIIYLNDYKILVLSERAYSKEFGLDTSGMSEMEFISF